MNSKSPVIVWVITLDSAGKCDLLRYPIECTDQEERAALHLTLASGQAEASGHRVLMAFDARDPAGQKLEQLENFQSLAEQGDAPGHPDDPLWRVSVSVMTTMSANIRVHATNEVEAFHEAKSFIVNRPDLLSLDGDGDFRAGDFHIDTNNIERVDADDDPDGDATEGARDAEGIPAAPPERG